MMMDPSPIEPATVSLVLGYLSPLDAPLPPHLISRPLLQRHHFLALSIDAPGEYLAWPGSGSQAAITLLLEQFHHPHDLRFNVRYSADEETLQAHVCPIDTDIPTQFRLIFLWDPTDGWQYHNIDLMPFPRDSYLTIHDAYGALGSPNDFLSEPTHTITVAGDDDAYWNSYGQELDDGDNDPMSKSALKAHPDPNSEDAYWARYSSIHGSADSTVPSPLPVKRNADGTQTHNPGEERVFVDSSPLQVNDPDEEIYNPLQPPSPDALSRRLASLATRPESPPFEEENSSDDSDLAVSPDQPQQHPELESEQQITANEPASPFQFQQYVVVDDPTPKEDEGDESDAALEQSIQGLYRLWAMQRKSNSQVPNGEAFLSLVRRAIGEP